VDASQFNAIVADNQYGLAVYAWTAASKTSLQVVRQLRAGRIWVNANPEFWLPELPVGGFADSGWGARVACVRWTLTPCPSQPSFTEQTWLVRRTGSTPGTADNGGNMVSGNIRSESMGQISRPLSLVEKLKQESVQEFINKFLWNKSNSAPFVVELDPTTACNLACHDCISANLLNQGGIDNERLMRLAEEFAQHGVRAVVLIGGGEPMAHPKFGALVESLYQAGIKVGVTTNGTLMPRYMDQCINMTSWLRVSVDAGSEEVFAEFRPMPAANHNSIWSSTICGRWQPARRACWAIPSCCCPSSIPMAACTAPMPWISKRQPSWPRISVATISRSSLLLT
jgi:hypothetical protein